MAAYGPGADELCYRWAVTEQDAGKDYSEAYSAAEIAIQRIKDVAVDDAGFNETYHY